MATKVFISQPMRGKTDQEIIGERKHVTDFLSELLKEPFEVFDNYVINVPCSVSSKATSKDRIPIWHLSKSIEMMAEADIVFFCKGWEENRGCVIEHEVAERYGITIIEE